MTPAESEFEAIVASTDRLLWKAYEASIKNTPCPEVHLRFPTYRTDDLEAEARHRVSEQEARFIVAGELDKSSLLYAVEAPTFEKYQFTGQKALSGKTDIAVYFPNHEKRERMWNVEFKAHGFSAARTSKSSIRKDIEKLLREEVNGFWFHTLEGVDGNTLKAVSDAFTEELRNEAIRLTTASIPISQKILVFHVCVLRQAFSIEMRIPVDSTNINGNWLTNVPVPTYLVRRDSLVSVTGANGWTVRQKV